MAPMLSAPPAQRFPSESQGGVPITTLSGRRVGALKCDRNSSTNIPSKSAGNFTAVSCDTTDILMIAAIESDARRVSRQPAPARRGDGFDDFEGFLAQAIANASAGRATVKRRGPGRNCPAAMPTVLETEVRPHPRFHLLWGPEGHPDQIHFHFLHAGQRRDFLFGVGHQLGA